MVDKSNVAKNDVSSKAKSQSEEKEAASERLSITSENVRIMSYIFVCANYNKDEDKIVVCVLDYKGVLENGQYDVSSFDKPLLKFWVDRTAVPSVEKLIRYQSFTPVYLKISGSKDFLKIHKVLDKADYDKYIELISD